MTDPIAAWPGELVPRHGAGAAFRAQRAGARGRRARAVRARARRVGDQLDRPDGPAAQARRPTDPGEPALACEAAGPARVRLLAGASQRRLLHRGDGRRRRRADREARAAGRCTWPATRWAAPSASGLAARRPDLVRTLTLISPALPDLRPRVLPMRLTLLCAPGLGPWLLNRVAQRFPRSDGPRCRSGTCTRTRAWCTPSGWPRRSPSSIRRDGLGYADDVLLAAARGLVDRVLPPRSALAVARRGPGDRADAGHLRQP